MTFAAPTGRRAAGIVLVAAATIAAVMSTGAQPASATDPSPAWTWVTGDSRVPPPGFAQPMNALSTGTVGTWAGPDYLTPRGLSPSSFDVAADGSTVAVGGDVSGPDQIADPWSVDPTRGLVVVRRENGVTTARVIATDWAVGPVLSSDGSTAWWASRGVVYGFADGVTRVVSASVFAPRSGETMTALAVSPDGTKGAALYWSTAGARMLAAGFVSGRTGSYLELALPAAEGPYSPDCFTWSDDGHLLARPTGQPTNLSSFALSDSGGTLLGAIGDPAGWYRPRLIAGIWHVWGKKPTQYGTTWSYRSLPDPLVANADPIATWSPQFYTELSGPPAISSVVPPSMGEVADVRASGAGRLTLSASNILYGRRALTIAYGQYLAPLPGQSLATSGQKVAGALEYSTDGTTWRVLRWNSLPVRTPWPGTTTAANGYATVTRSVWLRYHYRGDALVAPLVSPVRRLTVTPLVTVKAAVSRSGRSRLLYGNVTRVGGTALLYRYSRGRYVVIARTSISSSGRWTFGWRVLPHGSYKVASVADRDWCSGRRVFRL